MARRVEVRVARAYEARADQDGVRVPVDLLTAAGAAPTRGGPR